MSTIWVMDESLKNGWIVRVAKEKEINDPTKVIVRDATIADIPAMLVSEEKTWVSHQRATKKQIESRIRVFPEGNRIAIKNGEVLGIGSTLIMDYPWDKHIETFLKRIDDGFIRNHDLMGDTLCGGNIGSIPDAPPNLASAMVQVGIADLLIKRGISYFMGSPRLPGYQKFKDTMTIEEYAHKKDENGKYVDPVLRFHQKAGFKLVAVKADYWDDEESNNYSAIVKMENPMLPYSFEKRYNHLTKKAEVCLIFSIPIGCFWAKKPGGRCTNCGFQVGIDAVHQQMKNIDIIFNDFIGIFDRAMAHIGETNTIVFYTGGSFFVMPKYRMEAY